MFRGEVHQVKHLNPDSIIFSLFTTDEIRKLSVLKISSAVTFDALGYPLPGGFYDRVLGPSATRDELCGTCFKNIFRCPGHFGHIELPLPVLNPLFTKILGTILRISCFHCYMIQIPDHVKHSVAIQMKLLNSGLLMQAMEIEDKIAELIREYSTLENIPEDAVLPIKEYETLAKTILEESNSRIIINKNLEGLKNQFTSDLLREMKARKQCMHCKEGLDKIQVVKNKFVLSVRSMPDKEVTDKKIVVFKPKQLNPEELRKYARKVWEKEKDFLLQLVPVLKSVRIKYPTDVFFFEIIPVPPPNVRPVARMHDRLNEHEQTRMYKTILQDSVTLRTIMQVIKSDGDEGVLPDLAKNVYMVSKGSTPTEKMYLAWDQLQSDVINILDKDPQTAGMEQGLKQIIEKKAGIIRKHMMGKRVNYSARSVITPDPNLNIDEIGIPEAFAKHLTYPVPVTSWNVEELRKMILNGPNVHPGAVMVEFENGTVKRINPLEPTLQESILKRLLTPDDGNKGFKGVKMVHRHLCNGDILLLNRQPTLHRPSIMAHTARILKAEKTLRLHYANCKAYNADFDGDEMNAHFPQNELARSEGYTLANVSNQYLVPKDGTPLSGLIQDHMISGVRMSVRGRFFNKFDYHHLVFQALSHMTAEIILLPPAIIKPMCLWSGKQILSTVIINILPKNNVVINLTATSKIPAKSWVSVPPRNWTAGGTPFKNDNEMSEAEVIIRNGELLVGVLDKTHYGATPYGLVHCIYELYGGSYSTKFLSSLAKLFTIFLQIEGFTLGVHDILVMPGADKKRVKTVKKSRKIGKSVLTTALDLPRDTSLDVIVEKLEESMALNPKTRNIIDRQYKISLDSYTNEINKTCLPAGLLCKFPHNNLQLMVQSGAKGSTVNTMQISCLLGQIELEGKRPPVMISGKSLPSFPIFEFTPRAGGFIDGRFMTGIQPQEFFFHCMAGREGLIDTAVKTSRSGYLQRCLIKHLEGLTVGYDMTVRDSDKSVIQFHYGEDGMDISKAQFLNSKQLRFLSENCKAILNKDMIGNLKSVEDYGAMEEHLKNFRKWKEENGNPLKKARTSPFSAFSKAVGDKVDNEVENPHRRSKKTGRDKKTKYIINLWRKAEDDIKSEFKELSCPSPISSKYQPDCYFGSLNERLMDVMEQFQGFKKKKERKQFENMFKLKAMHSLCAPGEPVGLLAAQSIGEPSTQMTLNTFHFAGRGEMNVTLGIPRLREILMMASKAIKTPSIEIPFLNVPNLETKADNLRKLLTRVVVADVLEKIDVTLQLDVQPIRQYRYTLHFKFLPHALYKADYHAKPRHILKHMTKKFFGQMFTAIRRYAKITSKLVSMEEDKSNRPRKMRDDVLNEEDQEDEKGNSGKSKSGKRDVNDMDSSDEEVEDPEDAKLSSKFQQVHEDQEPDEEEVDIDFSDSEYENDDDGTKKQDEAASITNTVVENYHYAQDYVYDHENHLWCNITFALPLNFRRIDLTAILRDVAAKSVIWETPNIKRAITYKKDDQLMLRTDGINIVEMFKYNELLDLNKLYSNDIHKVATNYGIEAAVKVIVKEVQDVFNVYGIKVDPRHLLLIADYMTFNGSFEPLSRKGMESSASPLQQMSFESSLTFLKQATLRGKQDQLQNPSSCLMLGKPCSTGTGAFTLLQQIPLLGVAK